MKITYASALALALATIAVPLANAASHADPVEARQQLMKAIGGQVKILGDMAKGETAFDADAANAAAQMLAEQAAEIPAAYETESLEGKTRAIPLIWEDFDGFTAEAKVLEDAATAAVGMSELADVRAALGGIGKSCGSCHETYRSR